MPVRVKRRENILFLCSAQSGPRQAELSASDLPCATLRPVKLGELIDTRRRALNLSYDEAVDRARSRGFTLSKSALYGYATEPLSEPPRRRTIEGIAAALDLEYHEVVMAMAESMIGQPLVEMANNRHVLSWLTLTGGRTDEEVASVLNVVRTVTAALDAAHTGRPEGVQHAHRSDEHPPSDNVGVPPE